MNGAPVEGARRLAAVRAVVFGLLAVKAALETTPGLGRLPRELVSPVLPLSLLPDGVLAAILSPGGIVTVGVVTAVLCGLAALGRLRGAALLLPLAPLWIDRAVLSSFGYVGHAESALLLGAVALALFSAIGSVRPERASLAVLLVLTTSYAVTGLYRVAHGLPDVFDADVLRYWAARNATWDCWETDLPFACGEAFSRSATFPRVLAAAFPLVTLLEIASPAVLVSRRFAAFWLGGAVAFHVLSLFVLSILFWENVLLATVLLARGQLRRRGRAGT